MKSIKRVTTLGTATVLLCMGGSAAAASSLPPKGWLAWHRYSSYGAMDSVLSVQAPNGTQQTIQGNFVHPMNAHFGSHPYDLVFMAIDPQADEWDLFRANLRTGTCVNLTPQSGRRNEDPKFSPDGTRLVFKRGVWDTVSDGFRYDLAELDLRTGAVTMLTDTPEEESMPYYGADDRTVYFSCQQDGGSVIASLDRVTGAHTTVFSDAARHAYYPIFADDALFFAAWHTSDNPTDGIFRIQNDVCERMLFSDTAYNCSDPCPLPDGTMLYSNSQNGTYDLYWYDGADSTPLTALNTELQELGAAFYSQSALNDCVQQTADYLLRKSILAINSDTDGDDAVDAFDLCALKQALLMP